MATLVDGLFQLYIAIAIGIVIGIILNNVRRKTPFREKILKLNTKIVLNIATPALIFTSLLTAEIMLTTELVLSIILVQASSAIIGVIMAIFIMKKRGLSSAQIGTYTLISGWPNATIFPLPIVISVFGDSFITIVILFSSSALTLRATLATYLCIKFGSGSDESRQEMSLKRILREIFSFPPFICIIIAVLLLVFSVPIPSVMLDLLVFLKPGFSTFANWFGAITVGMILAGITRTQLVKFKGEIPWAMLLRFVIPAFIYIPLGFILVFPQDSETIKTILLLEVLGPPAIINTMFAANFGLDKDLMALMVVLLTSFMIVFAPIVLMLGSILF